MEKFEKFDKNQFCYWPFNQQYTELFLCKKWNLSTLRSSIRIVTSCKKFGRFRWNYFMNLLISNIAMEIKDWKMKVIGRLKFRAIRLNLPVILLLFALYNANVPLSLSFSPPFNLFHTVSRSFWFFFPYILSAFWFVWLMSYLTALLVQRNRKQERHTASWLISISTGAKRRQGFAIVSSKNYH